MKMIQKLALAGATLLTWAACNKAPLQSTAVEEQNDEKVYIDPVPGGGGQGGAVTETTLTYGSGNFTNTTTSLGGALGGVQMVVSNQPEDVTSRGWVYRGSINDGSLGSLRGISGNMVFYLYHYLRTALGTGTKAYLVARNVTAGAVTVTGRGYYEVKQSASDLSTSLRTARNWLNDKKTGTTQPGTTGGGVQRLRNVSVSIPANSLAILDEVLAPLSQTIDGRYELNASNSVVLYLVFENLDAFSASAKLTELANIVGSNTRRATGVWQDAAGYIVETGTPSANAPTGLTVPTANGRFGRECGIYKNSDWIGVTNITSLPASTATLRLHYNTSTKSGGQEQCADVSQVTNTAGTFDVTTPVDQRAFQGNDYALFVPRPNNAKRSYGNYGHYYQLTFNITNNTGRPRRVQLEVGRSGSARYYAPFWIRASGSTIAADNVDAITDVVLDPSIPGGTGTERPISTVTIANGTTATIRVNAIVPGSITIGQFMLVRTLD